MKYSLILLLLSATCGSVRAQAPDQPHVRVDLPVLEMPFNGLSDFPSYFSMRQSLALSTGFYQGFHRAIGGDASEPQVRRNIWWVAGFDFLSFYVPLGNAWLHEEWHRSVMTRRGIGSFNDVNTFPFGRSLIAVSHVDDRDLVRLKRDHPAEQVRLSSAGMESQIEQNLLVEKSHFFHDARSFDQILLWMNAINVSSYLATCSSPQADESTDQQNEHDGADLPRRDFTGLDCTAWVYDLFRPDEPYADRGAHPSGVGLDRYIRYSDLSDKEKDFLALQRNLSFLNFADPFLYGFRGFDGRINGHAVRWNLKLAHFLTSFGATVDAVLFLRTASRRYLLTWHNGMTDTRYFPGLSVENIGFPLPWDRLSATTKVTVWRQPRGQRIEETAAETVVSGSAQVFYELSPHLSTYLGLEAKTPGWIAGNVFLDRNLTVWTGFRAGMF